MKNLKTVILMASRQPRLYPYTLTAQNGRASRSMIYRCLVPGCNQQFTRTDFRGKHLRIQHGLPIPKGCWAKAWILKAENYQNYLAAVAAQAHANSILSPWTREREVDLECERREEESGYKFSELKYIG